MFSFLITLFVMGVGLFKYRNLKSRFKLIVPALFSIIFLGRIENNNNYQLTGEQISQAWQDHIGLPLLWVSNLSALLV